jgi:hypothetical protein
MHGSLNKRMKLLLGVPLLGLGLLGCLDAQGHATNLAAGSYQLSFALAAGNASVPVSGVNLTVSLPPGVSVATTGSAGAIADTALVTGGALTGTSLVSGRYDASDQQVQLVLATVPSASWSGEFARLTVTIPADSFTASSLATAVGTSFPAYQVEGLAASTHDPVLLSSLVTTTVTTLP